MNDPLLAAALRSGSPDALPELLDAYGDRLFSYCWCLLRNRENAQIAVRDALVVATAQIGRLDYDEWLGLWLYSLARAECLRREPTPAGDADEPAARPHQDDADFRLVAWKAVMSMAADEVEVLELDCRHDVDLRLVLGLSAASVTALLDRAHRNLERALGAEIVIRKSHACPDRAQVLSGWTGITTPTMLDHVLEHAATCPACGPNLPRTVSPARVFALLPAPALSPAARLEIVEFFDDPGMFAYRDFAVSRAAQPATTWFLSAPEPDAPAADPGTPAADPGLEPGAPAADPGPEPATSVLHAVPEAAGSEPVTAPEPLAEVIPLIVRSPAEEALLPATASADVLSATAPAPAPRAARRRRRASGIALAAVASVAVTALFVLVGFHGSPSATTASDLPPVPTSGPGSAAAQPGGANAAVPVQARRSPGLPSTSGTLQHAAATKGESLTVAASRPGTSPPSTKPGRPSTPGTPASGTPASSPASAGTPSATGSLIVTPDRLDLGTGSTGQLTLTATGGPVDWSADTSSTLVTLSSLQGTLQAGQSVTLVVTVNQRGHGASSAFVFIDATPETPDGAAAGAPSAAPSASQAVEVTWTTSNPRNSRPSPSPSPTPSSSPSPTPSPSS